MTPSLEDSAALHRAIARYRVYISRRLPTVEEVLVATDLNYDDALKAQDATAKQLPTEEPHLQGRMCRSIAMLEMINSTEVRNVLGYGPGFTFEAAKRGVEAYLQEREHGNAPIVKAA